MEHEGAQSVRGHLLADFAYRQGMVRFIENNDEPRAAEAFPGDKGRAAAVVIMTLPGFRLLDGRLFVDLGTWRFHLLEVLPG